MRGSSLFLILLLSVVLLATGCRAVTSADFGCSRSFSVVFNRGGPNNLLGREVFYFSSSGFVQHYVEDGKCYGYIDSLSQGKLAFDYSRVEERLRTLVEKDKKTSDSSSKKERVEVDFVNPTTCVYFLNRGRVVKEACVSGINGEIYRYLSRLTRSAPRVKASKGSLWLEFVPIDTGPAHISLTKDEFRRNSLLWKAFNCPFRLVEVSGELNLPGFWCEAPCSQVLRVEDSYYVLNLEKI